jgi:hypothetical protein
VITLIHRTLAPILSGLAKRFDADDAPGGAVELARPGESSCVISATREIFNAWSSLSTSMTAP